MEDYKRLYTLLFNAITDALGQLAEGRVSQAQEMLAIAQQDAEELFLSAEE